MGDFGRVGYFGAQKAPVNFNILLINIIAMPR